MGSTPCLFRIKEADIKPKENLVAEIWRKVKKKMVIGIEHYGDQVLAGEV